MLQVVDEHAPLAVDVIRLVLLQDFLLFESFDRVVFVRLPVHRCQVHATERAFSDLHYIREVPKCKRIIHVRRKMRLT